MEEDTRMTLFLIGIETENSNHDTTMLLQQFHAAKVGVSSFSIMNTFTFYIPLLLLYLCFLSCLDSRVINSFLISIAFLLWFCFLFIELEFKLQIRASLHIVFYPSHRKRDSLFLSFSIKVVQSVFKN